jgi:Transposase DDE domain group 1
LIELILTSGKIAVDETVAPVLDLGNFLRTLATPEPIKDWSLTSLKEKLMKIGAKVVSHGRYIVFQMAEVAIPRQMFQEILRLAELRPQPPPAPA